MVPLPCDVPPAPATCTSRCAGLSAARRPGHPRATSSRGTRSAPAAMPEGVPVVRAERNDPGAARVGGCSSPRVELALFRAPIDNDGFKLMPELARRIRCRRHGARPLAWTPASTGCRPRTSSSTTIRTFGSTTGRRDPHPRGRRARRSRRPRPRRRDVRRCRRASTACAGSVEARSRTTPTATAVRCSASGNPTPTSRRTWCPRSSACAPTAAGSSSSTRRPAHSCASTSSTRSRCTSRPPTSARTTCTRRATRPICDPPRLVVHVDVAHRGLGTASCGPDVLDRYRIRPDTYRFSYRLITSWV